MAKDYFDGDTCSLQDTFFFCDHFPTAEDRHRQHVYLRIYCKLERARVERQEFASRTGGCFWEDHRNGVFAVDLPSNLFVQADGPRLVAPGDDPEHAQPKIRAVQQQRAERVLENEAHVAGWQRSVQRRYIQNRRVVCVERNAPLACKVVAILHNEPASGQPDDSSPPPAEERAPVPVS